MAGDRDRVAALLGELGFATRDGDPAPLCEIADIMMAGFRDAATLAQLRQDPRAGLARAMAALRANPVVVVPRHFVLLARVFGTVGGLISEYQPAFSLLPVLLGAGQRGRAA
jgi:hypothetical protein